MQHVGNPAAEIIGLRLAGMTATMRPRHVGIDVGIGNSLRASLAECFRKLCIDKPDGNDFLKFHYIDDPFGGFIEMELVQL